MTCEEIPPPETEADSIEHACPVIRASNGKSVYSVHNNTMWVVVDEVDDWMFVDYCPWCGANLDALAMER